MRQVTAVDGFRLAYDRDGRGPAAVLLHGWPGDRADYEEVAPLVAAAAEVITPDLRGFGESDKHQADPAGQYSADAQARSVAALIEELGLERPVIEHPGRVSTGVGSVPGWAGIPGPESPETQRAPARRAEVPMCRPSACG